MELSPGYKRTEVGVIPEDWETSLISDIALTSSGTTPARASADRYFKNGSIPWVKTLDLNNAEIIKTEERVTKIALTETSLKLFPTGTVLVAMYGGYVQIGRTGLLRMPATVNQAITAIIPENKKLHSVYLLYVLNYRVNYWKLVASSSRKDPNITGNDVKAFPIAMPSASEQQSIATALSDVDALINGLSKLITKKRDIKQATMQQLLTGKTRLPGFSGKWKELRLGEILTVCHGKNQREVECVDGAYPILATGGKIGTASRPLYDKPSVLIGRKGTINQPQYMETPFWTVDTLFYSVLKNDNNAKYFYYRFLLIDWMQFNEASGVPSLNARTIDRIEVNCPAPDEQTAIAQVLSDMDAEIAALEKRLEKTRLIKQGMMQELLTGRIRLV
jgi:type I restriction enzyme, S subunit